MYHQSWMRGKSNSYEGFLNEYMLTYNQFKDRHLR